MKNLFVALALLPLYAAAQTPGGSGVAPRFWIKANASVYQNNGTTLVNASGQSVQQWNDGSSNSLHLRQTANASKPTYLNGSTNAFNYNPVISFGNSHMATINTSGLFPTGTTYSNVNIYLVYQDLDANDFDWLFYQGTSGLNRISYSSNYAGSTAVDLDVTTSNRLSVSTATDLPVNTVNIGVSIPAVPHPMDRTPTCVRL